MRYQIALITDVPIQVMASIFGPMEQYGEAMITKRTYNSDEMMRTLIGTAEAKTEQLGGKNFGACIIPFGAKPPEKRKNYRRRLMLKERLDGGQQAAPNEPAMFELRPPNQRFYAAEAGDLKNPESIVIPPNEWYKDGLKEKDIVDYYNAVADLIVKQYVHYDLDGMTLIKIDEQIIIKRHAKQEVMAMKIGDREAFDQLNRGRTVEFHFAVGEDTKMVWIDLDPKAEFPWDDVKSIAAEIAGRLDKMPESLQVEIRFSGKSGFHVICIMQNMMPTSEARFEMEKFVKEFLAEKNDDRLTAQATKDPKMMRLDFSTLHATGGLRTPYSLAYPTGLVCFPLTPRQVANFDKSQATIYDVLQRMGRLKRKATELKVMYPLMYDLWRHWNARSTVDFPTAEKIIAIMPEIERSQTDLADFMGETFRALDKSEESIDVAGLEQEISILKEIIAMPVDIRNLIATWWTKPLEPEDAKTLMEFYKNLGDYNKFKKMIESITSERSISTRILDSRLLGLEYIIKRSASGLPILAEDLEKYWEKREFDETPEPKGEIAKDLKQIFVVQKHDAHQAGLHYDLRLASEGVLKSWAVPKMMNLANGSKDMVLAIQVEDHPLDYAGFEGTIPSGYGAGKVVIWDKGTYEMTSETDKTLKFNLHGNKLTGPFILVKQAGDRWLLRQSKEPERKEEMA